MVVVFVFFIPVGGLTIFHIVLIVKGRTTNEQVSLLFCVTLRKGYCRVTLKVHSINAAWLRLFKDSQLLLINSLKQKCFYKICLRGSHQNPINLYKDYYL